MRKIISAIVIGLTISLLGQASTQKAKRNPATWMLQSYNHDEVMKQVPTGATVCAATMYEAKDDLVTTLKLECDGKKIELPNTSGGGVALTAAIRSYLDLGFELQASYYKSSSLQKLLWVRGK